MRGIIEMTDPIGLDYYYVTINRQGDYLLIDSPGSLIKELHRQLKLSEIKEAHWEVCGKYRRLMFSWEAEVYGIVDTGDVFIQALGKKLQDKSLA